MITEQSIIGKIVAISKPKNDLPYLDIEVSAGDVKVMVIIHTSVLDIATLSRAYEAVAQADAEMKRPL